MTLEIASGSSKSAAANRRPAGQSDGSSNLFATVVADRAFPAAVAELGSLEGRMKKLLLGMFLGVLVSIIVGIPLLRYERRLSWELGKISGAVDGGRACADALEKELGRHDGRAPYTVVFDVKHTSIVCIETNGVRTVRVIP